MTPNTPALPSASTLEVVAWMYTHKTSGASCVSDWRWPDDHGAREFHEEPQLCRLSDAQAEIQALRADARRLDWLEQWHDMTDGGDVGVNTIERTSDGWWSEIGDSEHDTLRAAIDAAVSARGEGGQ